MANYKRKRPGTSPTHGARNSGIYWLSNWPRWWDIIFHTRPRRRREKHMLKAVMSNRFDFDEACFDIANHKPHRYYW